MAPLLQLRRILLLALCVAAATEVDAKKHHCRPKPIHGGIDKGGNHHHGGEIPRPVEYPQGHGGTSDHGHWNGSHGHDKTLCCQWAGQYESKDGEKHKKKFCILISKKESCPNAAPAPPLPTRTPKPKPTPPHNGGGSGGGGDHDRSEHPTHPTSKTPTGPNYSSQLSKPPQSPSHSVIPPWVKTSVVAPSPSAPGDVCRPLGKECDLADPGVCCTYTCGPNDKFTLKGYEPEYVCIHIPITFPSTTAKSTPVSASASSSASVSASASASESASSSPVEYPSSTPAYPSISVSSVNSGSVSATSYSGSASSSTSRHGASSSHPPTSPTFIASSSASYSHSVSSTASHSPSISESTSQSPSESVSSSHPSSPIATPSASASYVDPSQSLSVSASPSESASSVQPSPSESVSLVQPTPSESASSVQPTPSESVSSNSVTPSPSSTTPTSSATPSPNPSGCAAVSQVVGNPGFETSDYIWAVSGTNLDSGFTGYTSSNVYDGRLTFVFQGTSTGTGWVGELAQTVIVCPNTRYRISIFSSSSAAPGTCSVEFFGNTEPGPQFSEYTGELTTDALATELRIRVRVQCESGGSDNAVFIDNVTMSVVDDSEPVPNPPPSPTEPAEASSSSTYSEPAATSSTSTTPPSETLSPTVASSSTIPPPASSTSSAPPPPPPPPPPPVITETVINGDFESNENTWALAGVVRVNMGQSGIVGGSGIDGSRAYRIQGTSTTQSSSFTLTQNVAVKERTIYQVSSYVKQGSAGTCTISIEIGGMRTAGPLSPPTSFTQLQGQWASGEGQTSVTLALQGTCSAGGSTRALHVDNVSMMEVVA